jgi:hypothetical protein
MTTRKLIEYVVVAVLAIIAMILSYCTGHIPH